MRTYRLFMLVVIRVLLTDETFMAKYASWWWTTFRPHFLWWIELAKLLSLLVQRNLNCIWLPRLRFLTCLIHLLLLLTFQLVLEELHHVLKLFIQLLQMVVVLHLSQGILIFKTLNLLCQSLVWFIKPFDLTFVQHNLLLVVSDVLLQHLVLQLKHV